MSGTTGEASSEDMEVINRENPMQRYSDFLSGLGKSIDEVPEGMPEWIHKGSKKLRTLVESTANTKAHLRHLAFPSALSHLQEAKAILKYKEVPKFEPAEHIVDLNYICIAYENKTPIHPAPLVNGDKKIWKKFLDQLAHGTAGIDLHIYLFFIFKQLNLIIKLS